MVGWVASEELDHGAAQRPDVALNIGGGFVYYGLWGHPIRRPCRRQRLLRIIDLNGHPKIGDLGLPLFSQQDISPLQIPMRDMMLMQILQPFQDLLDILLHQFLLQGGLLHK